MDVLMPNGSTHGHTAFPWDFLGRPMDPHWTPVVYFFDSSMGLPWDFHGTSMVLQRDFLAPTVLPSAHDTSVGLPWCFHLTFGLPTGFHWTFIILLWDFHGLSVGRACQYQYCHESPMGNIQNTCIVHHPTGTGGALVFDIQRYKP